MRRKPTSYGVWKRHVNLILFLLATFQELRGQDYYCEHRSCFHTYKFSRHREKGSCTRSKADRIDCSIFFFLSDTVYCGDRFLINVFVVLLNISWILSPSGKFWGLHTNYAPETNVWIPETRSPHLVYCVVAFNHTTEIIAIVWSYCINFYNKKYIRNVNGNFI